MVKLSEHFTLEEMTYSDTAKSKGIKNMPTETHKNNLIHTCQYLCEPIRKLFNDKYKGTKYNNKTILEVSMKITSGYRSLALNNAIPGSSKTSQHSKGQAVDFDIVLKFTDKTSTKLAYTQTYADIKQWVKSGKLVVDQCIEEKSGNATWVHVSLGEQIKNARKQFLKYNGKTYITD